ncbi:hypothetical protein LCGC14_3038390 [marine sediment metagenome]|uniref:Uncharacterized protein n=1 Tax=marine sediment metagenome TaxID=412755 RepID=A0A0F8WQW2_9ZZZZ
MSNEDTSMDLTLNVKEFEEQKEEAKKRFNDSFSTEDPDKHYAWEDLWLDYSEEIVEGNTLKISGTMKTQDDEELGFFNLNVPLDFDKLIEIFQSYIKKLNKVKTVMESVKDE